jgi:hypothetical protein
MNMTDPKPDRCPTCPSENKQNRWPGNYGPCYDPWHDAPKPETQADAERLRAEGHAAETQEEVSRVVDALADALAEKERMLAEPAPPYPYFWRTAIQREKTRWHKLLCQIERELLPNLRTWKHRFKSTRGTVPVMAKRIKALETENASLLKRAEAAERECDGLRAFKNSADEALNSGDGVYRP